MAEQTDPRIAADQGGDGAETEDQVPETITENAPEPGEDPFIAAELRIENAAGLEDGAIALNICIAASGVTAITLSNIPDGAILSAGTDYGGGAVTLDAGELEGLTITPPDDFSGEFDISVLVNLADGSTLQSFLNVDATAVTDTPAVDFSAAADRGSPGSGGALDVNAAKVDPVNITAQSGMEPGAEDAVLNLDVIGNLPAGVIDDIVSLTLSGVPEGAALSSGADLGGGAYDLSRLDADALAALTVTPPAGFSGVVSVSLTVITGSGDVGGAEIELRHEADADTPALDTGEVTEARRMVGETTGIAPGAASPATGADGLETLSIAVSNPPGGGAAITEAGLSAPELQLGAGESASFGDQAIALNIADLDVSDGQLLSLTLSGIPDGAVLTYQDSNRNGDNQQALVIDGEALITPDQIGALTLTPPLYFRGEIPLTATLNYIDEDNAGGAGVTAAKTVTLTVEADAGDPAAAALINNVRNDRPPIDGSVLDLPLTISGAAADTDGPESIGLETAPASIDLSDSIMNFAESAGGSESVISIVLSGFPTGAGASISNTAGDALTLSGDGDLFLSGTDQLNGLTFAPPFPHDGMFNLSLTAVTSHGGVATASFDVEIPSARPEQPDDSGTGGRELPPRADGASGGGLPFGGNEDGLIAGLDGDDRLFGQSGDEVAEGGAGNDELPGAAGNGRFASSLGDGQDTFDGEWGRDVIAPDAGQAGNVNGQSLDSWLGGAGAADTDGATTGLTEDGGVVTLTDGSGLGFDGVERIVWQPVDESG